MQKLMKSWVFTLIVCILLAMFAALMFLSGFKVGGLHIGKSILHVIVALGLAIYAVFTLCPMVVRCRGILQAFVFGELSLLLLTATAHVLVNFGIEIPLLAKLKICSVVGLALWLRGAVETVHAYLSNAAERSEERVPLWRLLCYILLCAVGVWQLANPLISNDDVFIFLIGAAAALCAALFGYFTAMNRKATAEVRRAKKAERRRIRDEKRAERERKEAEARRLAEELRRTEELASAPVQIAPAPEAPEAAEVAASVSQTESAATEEIVDPPAQTSEEKPTADEAPVVNDTPAAPEAPVAKAEEKEQGDNAEGTDAEEGQAQEKPSTAQKKTGTATKKSPSGTRSSGAKKSATPRKATTVKKAAQAMGAAEAKLVAEAMKSDESAQ